jgi:hypothetical protein
MAIMATDKVLRIDGRINQQPIAVNHRREVVLLFIRPRRLKEIRMPTEKIRRLTKQEKTSFVAQVKQCKRKNAFGPMLQVSPRLRGDSELAS